MDRLEFSIAMHLIRYVLSGNQLPSTLPDSLKVLILWNNFFHLIVGNKISRMTGYYSSVLEFVTYLFKTVSSHITHIYNYFCHKKSGICI